MSTMETAAPGRSPVVFRSRGHSNRSATPLPVFVVAMVVTQALMLALSPETAAGQHDHPADGAPHQHAAEEPASPGDGGVTTTPLREPGNAAFAAIQEVLAVLRARDDTDWSRVDLEALRQHLVDMRRFTQEAVVLEQETIEGGLRVVVRGTSPAAGSSIRSAASAHGPMLESERGWGVDVRPADPGEYGEGATVLEVTAGSPEDVEEIRGLGYIGLMATGAHHREHHWRIATGRPPAGH